MDSRIQSILDALLIAERLEATGYAQGLESGVLDSLSTRELSYFRAAVSEEYSHAIALEKLGASVAAQPFYFPPGTFNYREKFLEVLLGLEDVGISAYSAAIYQFSKNLRAPRLALYAAQILGIEAEHRVLIRDTQGQEPPNNLCFEVVTSLSVAENAKALTPYLKPGQFCGESTEPAFFPDASRTRKLAGQDYCVNPRLVPGFDLR